MKTFLTIALMMIISLVMITGCAALLGEQDPAILQKLQELEIKASTAKLQAQAALDEIKKNGLSAEAVQKLFSATDSTNQIIQQIADIKKQAQNSGSPVDWVNIILAMISGLSGYPIMRTLRLKYANSTITGLKIAPG